MSTPVQGEVPADEDEFYLEWGRETLKKNIERVQSVIEKFLTLNTALVGGSVVAVSPNAFVDRYFQILSVFCFFVGLVISFVGLLPLEGEVDPRSPSMIRDHKEKALNRKFFLMWAVAFSTLTGLFFISVGVLCK